LIDWLSNVWNIVLVVLGIGGVIFLHECGHFFAARWCKVRVEVFSLGFGPRVFGFRRGSTNYQLALLPLGGYVKMAGEEPLDGRAPADDELPSKSVGQRFFIYSGGVIANVLTGLIVFPILFAIGVPFDEPVTGLAEPGGPAWQAGIEPGLRVKSVNGTPVVSGGQIRTEVALGPKDRTVLVLADAEGRERTVELVPKFDPAQGLNTLGLFGAEDRQGSLEVLPDSAAHAAGLRSGDQLLDVAGTPAQLTWQQRLECARLAGRPLEVRVRRGEATLDVRVEPRATDKPSKFLGLGRLHDHVAAVRDNELTARLGIAPGDRLLRVAGQPLAQPYDFACALHGAGAEVEFQFERQGERRTVRLEGLAPADRERLAESLALTADPESPRVLVVPGTAAERAGLRSFDRIKNVDQAEVRVFSDYKAVLDEKKAGEAFQVTVERAEADGSTRVLVLEVAKGDATELAYGLAVAPARYVYSVTGLMPALREGARASWGFLRDIWVMLKRIAQSQVDSDKAVGGIISISVTSHSVAKAGIVPLLFFLCILSMNLAFMNILPIPVLDGGHLLFLLIEKIKGSPVSERVMGYSQMVGIVLILSLMVYVTFNDIRNQWFS